jgi:hypothetical protein
MSAIKDIRGVRSTPWEVDILNLNKASQRSKLREVDRHIQAMLLMRSDGNILRRASRTGRHPITAAFPSYDCCVSLYRIHTFLKQSIESRSTCQRLATGIERLALLRQRLKDHEPRFAYTRKSRPARSSLLAERSEDCKDRLEFRVLWAMKDT